MVSRLTLVKICSIVLMASLFAASVVAQGYGGLDYTESQEKETYEQVAENWKYSKQIDFSEKWDGGRYWGQHHRLYSIQLNTKELIREGKLREDCQDIRIASEGKLAGTRVQSPTCNTTETWIYFSNTATAFGTKFDPEEKIDTIEVFYGNKDEGLGTNRVSEYNRNLATRIRPESAIEMYFGSHDSTWVSHSNDGDPHLHSNNQDAPSQTWHVDFQHDHGDLNTARIHIEDQDGNSQSLSASDTFTLDSSNIPNFVEEGETISVYFESAYNNYNNEGVTYSSRNSAVWGNPNSPATASNPDPAQASGTSPVYNTHPELTFQVSDPDDEPVDVDIYNGFAGTWNFNTCGASGSTGPSQSQCDNSYSGTNLDSEVNVVNPGIQEWTVPRDGQYRIRTAGASGRYGDGAVMQGTFNLNAGTTLQILVGQESPDDGGSGGTFVATGNSHTSASPLVVAGGGAGGDGGATSNSHGATHTYGQDASTGANGGNNGYGGSGDDGGGGAGFYGNGNNGGDGQGGDAFQNGGRGGSNSASDGGFGGGGTAESAGADEAGGAGGYSGGGAADDGGCECAGGGGSFIDSSASSAATHTGSFTDSSSNDNGYSGGVSDLGGPNTGGDGYVTIESQGSLLESQNNVPNGNTFSWEWSGRTIGQSYDWYVQACDDDNACTSSPVWTFTVEQGPLDPEDPEPADGEVVNSNQVDINARYRHQGGYDGTLRFYNADTGNEIYSCSVSDGNKCSSAYSWDVNSGQTYEWYAVAESNGASERGPSDAGTWSFTTNTAPDQPSNPSPSDSTTGVDYNSGTLEADVNDPDGHDMTVTFNGQGQSTGDTFSRTTSVSGSGTASVSYSGLETGETYEWTVTAEDEHGVSTTSDTWTFTTNYLPTIENPSPTDNAYVSSDTVQLGIDVSDQDGDQTDVRIYDDGGTQIGSGSTADGSQVRVNAQYTGLSFGNSYDWTVEAEDAYGQADTTYSFSVIGSGSFRSATGIDYEYSSIIKSSGQSSYFEYKVTNENVNNKELETRLQGADAEFQQYGTSHTYTLNSGETKTFTVEVTEDTVGEHTVDVVTEDLRLGVQNVDSMPVLIREYPASDVQEVPGLMWLQVLFLAAGATVLYSALL